MATATTMFPPHELEIFQQPFKLKDGRPRTPLIRLEVKETKKELKRKMEIGVR
jgi:hypothetical protein